MKKVILVCLILFVVAISVSASPGFVQKVVPGNVNSKAVITIRARDSSGPINVADICVSFKYSPAGFCVADAPLPYVTKDLPKGHCYVVSVKIPNNALLQYEFTLRKNTSLVFDFSTRTVKSLF